MRTTVFTGARLIDGTGAAPVDAAAAVIEDGTFTYVGPAHSRPTVTGETVIDLGGRTLLPGFFDCHVHFLMDSNADLTGRLLRNQPTLTVFERARRMRETLYAGVTTVRDLGGIDAGYREAVALGLIEGPRLNVALRLISHTGGHADFRLPSGFDPSELVGPFSELADDSAQARLATRRLLRDGADVYTRRGHSRKSPITDIGILGEPDNVVMVVQGGSIIKDVMFRHSGRAGHPTARA